MSTNVETMVREAIKAYRAGKKAEARGLLEKATELDQYNEQAWMWLSAVVDSPDDQRTCLENVLLINPSNANAKQGLRILAEKTASTTTSSKQPPAISTPAESDDDPFANVNFTETPTASKPPASPPEKDYSGIATSSSSATFDPSNEPSTQDYDNWVAGLNIGSKSTTPAFAASASDEDLSDDAFGDVFATAFEDDDEVDHASSRLDSMFDKKGGAASKPAKSSASSSPFGDDFSLDEDFDFDLDADDSPSPSRTSSASFDDDLDLDIDVPTPASTVSLPKPTAPYRSKMSPVAEPKPDRKNKKSPAFKKDTQEMLTSSGLFVGDTLIASGDDIDPAFYFNQIPPNIKATRMPGVDEHYPSWVIVGMALLLAANLGALAFLAVNLGG